MAAPHFDVTQNDVLSTIDENEEDPMLASEISSLAPSTKTDPPPELKEKLTVQGKSKIEEALTRKTSKGYLCIVPVIKVFATMVIGLLVLFCIAVSKFSILSLTLNITAIGSNSKDRIENTSRFIALYFIFLCPYVFNLLRALWVGGLRKDMPWPSLRSILLALCSSILECWGLCIFTYKILGQFTLTTNLLLMNTVYVLPFILSYNRNKTRHPRLNKCSHIVLSLCALAGTVCILTVAFDKSTHNNQSRSFFWHVIVAIVTLTIAWSPFVKQELSKTQAQTPKNSKGYTSPNNNGSSLSTNVSSSSGFSSFGSTAGASVTPEEPSGSDTENNHKITDSPTFWKMGIIINSFNVIFITLFSFVFYYVDHSVYSSDLYFTETMYNEFREAWQLPWNDVGHNLVLNLSTSLIGYGLAFMALHVCMQKGAFILPVLLFYLLSPILLMLNDSCKFFFPQADARCYPNDQLPLLIISTVFLFMAIVLYSVQLLSKDIVLQKESKLFWTPTYNGMLLDQCLMLNKRNVEENSEDIVNKTRVYICTTMYRETAEEMKILLESMYRVNLSQMEGSRFFESHIIFDGGIRNRSLTSFALQLIGLLEPTLGISPADGTKVITPYGMKLSWRLPSERGKQSMALSLHLKDNLKVKNKKRWSQVMYMSFVLDFLMGDAVDEECFILTTDADVKFTPDSVEALLDLMLRDKSVGAVCARTHPMGSGPVVWYQIFDYAIGHWFQKAAEHVLGSVLCAPGCFSVYRCTSLKDVLPEYATTVEHADDFLTKDMGEDRWLCTLLVQSGWRIEYCAAAENSTNCPSDFDEFYKQRRRWIASTIANLMLILRKWYLITSFNHRVSILFIIYQGALLLSTLIGPSTIVLLVSGGLAYSWNTDVVTSMVLQLLTSIVFVGICLKATSTVQLQAAKVLTFVYAVIMTAVFVGTLEQIVQDLNNFREPVSDNNTTSTTVSPPQAISVDIPVSVTTIYLGSLIAIFVITALVHLQEFTCLLHGLWYLLCLPSGYVILNLYSICNLTDRSWGTREEKSKSVTGFKEPWYTTLSSILRQICFCCDRNKTQTENIGSEGRTRTTSISSTGRDGQYVDRIPSIIPDEEDVMATTSFQESGDSTLETDENRENTEEALSVESWLPPDLKSKYLHLFKKHGYDNTLFISGMSSKELESMGIKSKSHIHYLSEHIKRLPLFEIEFEVPTNVGLWLEKIGLDMYKENFKRNQIRKPYELQILKTYSRKECIKELSISKDGHIKRLMYAISKLRNPTEAERQANEVKAYIEMTPIHLLKESNVGENMFWKSLIDQCLTPGQEAFSIEVELKDALNNLRSLWLMVLAVTNTLWLILISTMASKIDLVVVGANPIGLAFLVIFGIIFVIQFLSMWVHRFQTLTHFLARAPYKCGSPYRSTWTFKDIDQIADRDTDDIEAITSVKDAERQAKLKQIKRAESIRSNTSSTEKTPLLQSRVA
ncbi:hypothetical protein SNE40_007319 [Patella caerulea]|uniref:chitin synthase n=2 Tax=Patella caerulea TaxID=87958 RepID=A0AAN8JZI5_PATCE